MAEARNHASKDMVVNVDVLEVGEQVLQECSVSASFELYEGAEGGLTKISRSFPLQLRGSASFLDEVLR